MAIESTYEDLQQWVKELEQKAEQLRQAEAKLIESEYKAQQYLGLPGVIFVALDQQGCVTLINENGLNVLGYQREELFGKNWFTTCLPDRFQKDVLAVYQQLMRGEIESVGQYENLILTKDGAERVIAWNNCVLRNPIGEIIGTLSSGEDITERRNTEKRLKEAYDIINKSPAVTFLWKNLEGWPVEFVSENVIQVFGYSATDFISGKVSYLEVLHPDDLERVIEEVADYSKGKAWKGLAHEPYRIVTKDDQIKWLDDQTFIRRDGNGKITHYQGIVLDITERKRVEEALKESENRYRSIVGVIPDLIIKLNRQGVYLDIISPTDELLFLPKKDLLGSKIADFMPKEVSDRSMECLRKCLDDQVLQIVEYELQVPVGKKYFESRSIPLSENLAYALVRDVTDQKRMEKEKEKLIESLRDALGQVKTLSGMLPICANCKKIRDDKGYWNQIELYIREHSEAEFSHGICPHCAKKLYPNIITS